MANVDDFEVGGRYLIRVESYWRPPIMEIMVLEKARRFIKVRFQKMGCDSIYNNLSSGEWVKDNDIEILEKLESSSYKD